MQIMLGMFRSGPTKGLKHCQVKDKILGERFVKVSGNSQNRLQVTSGLEPIHSFNKQKLKAYNVQITIGIFIVLVSFIYE